MSDPFGLDALIPSTVKKDEKVKGKKDMPVKVREEEEEESKRFLKYQREALITCLEIAARRYKIPWYKYSPFLHVLHTHFRYQILFCTASDNYVVSFIEKLETFSCQVPNSDRHFGKACL